MKDITREDIQRIANLMLEINKAKSVGDVALLNTLQSQLRVFDEDRWKSLSAVFPELIPYRTVREAVQQTCYRLQLPFPNIDNPNYSSTSGKIIFAFSNKVRGIQIWPMDNLAHYSLELYRYESHAKNIYSANTTSLDEVAMVTSYWMVSSSTIDDLTAQFHWIEKDPFVLKSPYMPCE